MASSSMSSVRLSSGRRQMTHRINALCCVVFVGCAGCSTPAESPPRVATGETPTGCREHVELLGAEFWARELGQSEMTVLANHRINLWERAGSSRGTKVGEMRVGARAVILETTPDAYRVRSGEGQLGWLSKTQVARTLYQDVESRKACTP